MSEAPHAGSRPRGKFSLLRVLVGVLIGAVILISFIPPSPGPSHDLARRTVCLSHLRGLALALTLYAEDHSDRYPTPEKWCDLLVDYTRGELGDPNVSELLDKSFRCPEGGEGRCHYAINPNADPCSAPDVVLLFESDGGWNGFGGPESLTTSRHEGKGCNVLFADGHVMFVKIAETPNLKWDGKLYGEQEETVPHTPNARRPVTFEEFDYWLRNMIWYHQFRTPEVQAAMGLKGEAINRAQEVGGIYRSGRPQRAEDASLLVLPYPGGRHPRMGFLEGAVDPQRETKFSVFAPWDPNSYVVVDVPEAIWSNLGLTYLAHTHVDTIWTKQGIELAKLEWNRRPDGSLDIERTLPSGIAFGVKAVPAKDAVRMAMWLKNGTDQRLTDLRVQMCVMTKMAAGFAEQTNKNKVFTNPYVACRSTDRKRWIITAWEGCNRPWGNEQCPCLHSDPKFPDLEPGRTHRLRGWLSFYEGDDVHAEFARIEATGWRTTEK